jgi:hypothetical protein
MSNFFKKTFKMIKVRVHEGKISRNEVLTYLKNKYGSLLEVDCDKILFEYEVFGLTLPQVNDIANRRKWLIDNVIMDGHLFTSVEYEFLGYDAFAKTNALKIVVDNLCSYLYGSV